MQRYEYLVISRYRPEGKGKITIVSKINNEDVGKQNIEFYSYLNKIGAEGWDLVGFDGWAQEFILKRQISE